MPISRWLGDKKDIRPGDGGGAGGGSSSDSSSRVGELWQKKYFFSSDTELHLFETTLSAEM